jgi:hypothetical protein
MDDEQQTAHGSWFIVHRYNVGTREGDEDEKNISIGLFWANAIPSVFQSSSFLHNR